MGNTRGLTSIGTWFAGALSWGLGLSFGLTFGLGVGLTGCAGEGPQGSGTQSASSGALPAIGTYAKSMSQPSNRACRAFNTVQLTAVRPVFLAAAIQATRTADYYDNEVNSSGFTERLFTHYTQNVGAAGVTPTNCESPFTMTAADMGQMLEEAINKAINKASNPMPPTMTRARVASIDSATGRMRFQSNNTTFTDWVRTVSVPAGQESVVVATPYYFMFQTEASWLTLNGMDVHIYPGAALWKNRNGQWRFIARATFNDDFGPEPRTDWANRGHVAEALTRAWDQAVGNPFLVKSVTTQCLYQSSANASVRLTGQCSSACLAGGNC